MSNIIQNDTRLIIEPENNLIILCDDIFDYNVELLEIIRT